MRNKEFREVQVSSSGLVFIFLAVLVLGVFIFLLGVNVGKKQVQMAGPTTLLARPAAEAVTEEPPTVLKDQPSTMAQTGGSAPVSEERARIPDEKTAEVPAASEKPAPRPAAPVPAAPKPAATSGAYYIQVGAFNDKGQADTFAARFKGQGYPALVLSPFSTDKRPTYRVRLVGYATREQASQVMAKLNAASTKRTGYYIRKEG
jgi:cell division protein FtsN